ncbi:MAG TPA: hypothetical protein VI688_07470 [Anaerolineales bacterium]|nr:hypothetical protein [Anaerolineales bacterium]HLE74068.1 hypothetical protein [Anaerolineales bacterium]
MLSRIILTFASALLLLASSGCRVTFAPAAPSETPTPAPSSTPTIQWFPPTPTASPFPTPNATPTSDLRPGIGELLLEDDFSEADAWTTGRNDEGVVMVSGGSIYLGLNAERSSLFSTRTSPVFRDFYAELTASPTLCSREDEYGVLIRGVDGNHYRFALSCDGRAKVDRYLGESLSRQAGWIQDQAIPSVIPGSSRLGVWASGSQLHFFVNGLFLFSVNDTQLYLGTIGVYVRTAGAGDVAVSFSDLQVWALAE